MKRKVNLLLLLLSLFVVIVLSDSSTVYQFELRLYDFAKKLYPKPHKNNEIVLIAIDDTSLKDLGKWPWSRIYHANLLNVLYYFNPSAIGFDLLFTESDFQNRDNDLKLAQMSEHFDNICFGYYFDFKKYGAYQGDKIVQGLIDQKIDKVIGDLSLLPEAQSVCLPNDDLSAKALLGYLNAPRGETLYGKSASFDGIVRDIPLIVRFGNDVYPSFALQLVREYLGVNCSDISVSIGEEIIITCDDKGDISIPIDDKGRMIINYVGGLDSFQTVSYESVLGMAETMRAQKKPVLDPKMFKDKIVIIAMTATGMDNGELPLSDKLLPMCLVHMNAIQTILNKSFINRLPDKGALYFALLLTTIVGFFAVFCSPWVATLVFLMVFIGVSVGYHYFLLNGVWVTIIPVLCGCGLVFLAVAVANLISEEREKRRIKNMFGHYVSGNVLEEILGNPAMLKLGGENRELTVLFSDIRSFTTYCEKRSPEEVVKILNEYLNEMTEIIIENGGTLDKYVGDEIMAVFGAPGNSCRDHPFAAVKTACDMIAKLKELHQKWAKDGLEPFYIGVGVNTGVMKVGNMGSEKLFDYTVIGDEVNVGARIEALTRFHNTDIIVSENTYLKIKDRVNCKKLGETKVKGKQLPVFIYEVVGIKS